MPANQTAQSAQTVNITRLITNQMILGKTTTEGDYIIITDPYTIVPGPEQLQIFPFDEAILGKKLDEIKVLKSSTIYTTEAPDKIREIYLEDKMGLEKPDQSIIV